MNATSPTRPTHPAPLQPPRRPRLGGAAATLLLVLAAAEPATAQDGGSLEQRLTQAMDAYDNFELEQAATLLDESLASAARQGSRDPVVADLYLMRGIVAWAMSGDRDQTIRFFTQGLEVHRDATLNVYYATPDLTRMLEQARATLPELPRTPTNVLRHQPAVTVRSGQALDLVAEIERGAEVERVVLFYRPAGQARYVSRPLDIQTPTRFAAQVPPEASLQGIQLEYYLEALGDSGEVLGHSGTAAVPHAVVILAGGGEPPRRTDRRLLGAALGVGTGGGLATGEPLVMGNDVDLNPGVALTPLHLYADVTFRLVEALELGPFLRLQTVLLQDGVETEFLVGGKLKWFFDDVGSPRMYASLGAGYGYVRHTVDLSPTVDFVDTTREGPFHGGVGFGVAWLFTENVGLLGDVYAMVLFDEVSVQLDLNLGLYLAF
jgi:hypothetical protein